MNQAQIQIIYKDSDVVLCPYDENHKIVKSRILWHIQKCKSSKENFSHCKYNYLHIYEKTKIENHQIDCPNRPQDVDKKSDNGDQAVIDQAFEKWKIRQGQDNQVKKEQDQNISDTDYEKYNREQQENEQIQQDYLSIQNDKKLNDTIRVDSEWLLQNDKPKYKQENIQLNLVMMNNDSDKSDSGEDSSQDQNIKDFIQQKQKIHQNQSGYQLKSIKSKQLNDSKNSNKKENLKKKSRKNIINDNDIQQQMYNSQDESDLLDSEEEKNEMENEGKQKQNNNQNNSNQQIQIKSIQCFPKCQIKFEKICYLEQNMQIKKKKKLKVNQISDMKSDVQEQSFKDLEDNGQEKYQKKQDQIHFLTKAQMLSRTKQKLTYLLQIKKVKLERRKWQVIFQGNKNINNDIHK